MCWGLRGAVVVGVYQRFANGKGIDELEEPGGGVAAGKRGEEREGGGNTDYTTAGMAVHRPRYGRGSCSVPGGAGGHLGGGGDGA